MRSPTPRLLSVVAAAAAASMLATAAGAANIVGTATNDVLKGSPGPDKLYGRAGNDSLRGFAGNDLLVGGAGADVLSCGGGVDTAIADAKDKVAKDCETVKGLPKPPPPAPPPPPPSPATPPPPPPPPPPPAAPPVRAGFYGGASSQSQALSFEVTPDSAAVTNLRAVVDVTCPQLNNRSFRAGLHMDAMAITADRSFGGSFTDSDADGTVTVTLRGSFAATGGASGSLDIDLTVNLSSGPVQCVTRATWNANPQ